MFLSGKLSESKALGESSDGVRSNKESVWAAYETFSFKFQDHSFVDLGNRLWKDENSCVPGRFSLD